MKVLLTGGTGLIGKELGKALVQRGAEVFVISRNAESARAELPFPCHIIEGNLTDSALKNNSKLRLIDTVINLVGESINGRWNEKKKRKIYESRILGTRHLIESLPVAPKVFISGSAIGYYGSQGEKEITEDSPPGDDFLAQVCQDWEEELLTFSYGESGATTRVIALRTGMVLSAYGGALEKLLPLFRRGLGGELGDGKQWMSWIHIDDVVGLILHALDHNNVRGPMNVVSPQPVTNEEFTTTLASVLDVGLAPRVPGFLLKASLGEMSNLVLGSQKALPQVAQTAGYKFKFAELQAALEDICSKDKEEIFTCEQYLPWKPKQVFPFFSHAANLAKITPSSLGFEIINGTPDNIQKGSEISYRLKIRGVPVNWKTVIQEWNPPNMFMDVQAEGPYEIWEHTHEFKAFGEGTLMTDRVRYRLPMGKIGSFFGGYLVRSEIEKIFQFRREYIIKNLERDLGISRSKS